MDERAIPVAALDNRIRQIDDDVRALQIERAMLVRLRQSAVPIGDGGTITSVATGSNVITGTGSMGGGGSVSGTLLVAESLTASILRFVREHPGRTTAEVVDTVLAQRPPSDAVDPRKSALTLVSQLVGSDRLTRDGRGGLHIAV